MVKSIDMDEYKTRINVYLPDGTEYFGKDFPERPIAEGVVNFWHNNKLVVIPLSRVERIVFEVVEK